MRAEKKVVEDGASLGPDKRVGGHCGWENKH